MESSGGTPVETPREVTGVVIVSLGLLIGLGVSYVGGRRAEIMANWSTYRTDPFILFMAPFLKPDADPRSRFQFAADNYSEVVKQYMDKVIAAALTPVYQIFGVLSSSIGTSANGLGAIKALLAKMFGGFQAMVDVFMRRFNGVSRALIGTFRQMLQALEHVWASAASSIYGALSLIYTMQNTIRLIINIVVTIIIILAVLMIFFFFALWPLLPIIITAGLMLGQMSPIIEAVTGVNGGGSDAASLAAGMCFHVDTRIVLADGSDVPLHRIQLGDRLEGDGIVEGILRFDDPAALMALRGVLVTGSHIVWEAGKPMFVKDHPEARPSGVTDAVLCLLTSHRRIPVRSHIGLLQFADWEELEENDEAALQAWYEHVNAVLNGPRTAFTAFTAFSRARSTEEAACSGDALVTTPDGPLRLDAVVPGIFVLNAEGAPTRVTGVVRLLGGSKAACELPCGSHVSTGCWMREESQSLWGQPKTSGAHEETRWFHLFTESGTFRLGGLAFRDFRDVGDDLPGTYNNTLNAMILAKNNRP